MTKFAIPNIPASILRPYLAPRWQAVIAPALEREDGSAPMAYEFLRTREGEGYRYSLFLTIYFDNTKLAEACRFYADGVHVPHEFISLGGAPAFELRTDQKADEFELEIQGERYKLAHSIEEHSEFAGLNSALLVLCDDEMRIVSEWIDYYTQHHGLEALLIIDRIAPGGDRGRFSEELSAYLSGATAIRHWRYLRIHAPLGKLEPSERAIYSAPDLPGRGSLMPPAIDPWRAVLANGIILENLRQRFLARARAVLFLSPYDLLPPVKGKGVFDHTVESPAGYVQLYGKRAYPWRVPNKRLAGFGDHICTRADSIERHRAWCVVPDGPRRSYHWRLYRIGAGLGEEDKDSLVFWRAMALKHVDHDDPNAHLAPRGLLARDEGLSDFLSRHFEGKPILPPVPEQIIPAGEARHSGRRLIVTTMKNEGPFILEWIAFHQAIGFDDFIVFSNDCTDGTDAMLDLLMQKGHIEHRDNPFRTQIPPNGVPRSPQYAAFFDAPNSERFARADWIICMDCDEYLNIHIGDGTLDDLFAAIGDANMISFTWRLFGNADIGKFEDRPIIEQFTRAAPLFCRTPHQAWGVKTLFRNLGFFRKLGVHRPKGLNAEHWDAIKWVNGSGERVPPKFVKNAWRSSKSTYGYDLATLNHYACRSVESFLVKRERGRVNHVDRDQGMEYWFRMNMNVAKDKSIHRHIPKMQARLDELLADGEIRAQHEACVAAHQKRIGELMASAPYAALYEELTSERMRDLSRLTPHFGSNVFMQGPKVVSDEVIEQIKSGQINFFTVRDQEPSAALMGEGT